MGVVGPRLFLLRCLVLLGSRRADAGARSSTIAEPAVPASSPAPEKTKPARQVTAREVPVVKAKLAAASDRAADPAGPGEGGRCRHRPPGRAGRGQPATARWRWRHRFVRSAGTASAPGLRPHRNDRSRRSRRHQARRARARWLDSAPWTAARVVTTRADGRTRATGWRTSGKIAKTRVRSLEVFRRDGRAPGADHLRRPVRPAIPATATTCSSPPSRCRDIS